MSRKGLVVAFATAVLLIILGVSGCNQPETPNYERTEMDANIVKIIGNPNVREEPILRSREDSNSLGTVRQDNFTLEVNGLLKADIDTNNGVYYGFRVEDINAQAEGTTWFPSRISKDADGIVWINHKYVIILY